MNILAFFFLILLGAQNTLGEISLKDYIYWTKADISAWHQYFPSRYLKQEHLTIAKAIETVATLQRDIRTSLAATVRYQQQELETAQFSFEGTYAKGCVSGLAPFMDKAIDDAVDSFEDCIADVIPSLKRVNSAWVKTNATYNSVYQKALEGVDNCGRIYPNRDSQSRLKSCVESFVLNYYTTANSTTKDLYSSKAMTHVSNTVGYCSDVVAWNVVMKGWTFLDKLVTCANLSENVNAEMYEKELTSEFDKYISSYNVPTQLGYATYLNLQLVDEIEQQMIHYYDLQKRALEKYVLESRNQSFYYSQMLQYIGKYLTTIYYTSVDNPANADCVSQAKQALENILNTGAAKAFTCDSKIVNNTKVLIGRVNTYFSRINDILPYTGNVATLSCLSKGYIFAEQTILECYNLELNSYKIAIAELNATIVDDVRVLQGYERSFFGSSSLPCGDSILSRVFLEADRALYNLQRCLYIGSGTKYEVTTYTEAPYTTTTSSATSYSLYYDTTTSTSSPSIGASRG